MDRLELAKKIVEKAKNYLRAIDEKDLKLDYKEHDFQNIVTNFDIAVEKMIVNGIKEVFPEDSFLTEEKTVESHESESMWILDPIDGTSNFASMFKDYAISLAYYSNNKPVFGIVCDANRDETFIGIAGQGAYFNGIKLPMIEDRELKYSTLDITYRSIVKFEKRFNINFKKLVNEVKTFRSIGSAALGICQIAQGHKQLYASNQLSLWDYAAAAIVLKETGGYLELIPNENGSNCVISGVSERFVNNFKAYR